MTSTQKLSLLLAVPALLLGAEAAVAAPLVTGVVNAASYASGPVAPGEIVSLFGTGMGPASLATQQPTDRYGASLSGVQVTFNGIAAPLLYVSATQIGAVVPYGVSGAASASVQVVYQAAKSNVLAVGVAASALGVFTANAAGTGAGAILNQNYAQNSPTNPAVPGDVIMVFGTGEGVTTPAGTDGVLDPNPAPQPVNPISATIGGQTAKVWYAGGSPGLVAGLVQLNVQIPASIVACSGTGVPLVLTSAGGSSQTQVTLQIQSATTCPGSAVKSLTFTTSAPGTYTGTVTLTSPTLAGALVSLVASSAAFQLPATVMIPASGISATFQATLPAGSTPQIVTVTANYVGSFAQATVAAAGKWISMVEVGPGPLVPSDGSENGIVSGSFTSNGSGGYQGGFTFGNNGTDAFPSFFLGFDNAQMAGDTLVVNSFTVALGAPTFSQVSQGSPKELPVTGAEIRITITNYNTGVSFWNGAFSGAVVVYYQAPVPNPADLGKPGATPAVFSATFTATGAISMR